MSLTSVSVREEAGSQDEGAPLGLSGHGVPQTWWRERLRGPGPCSARGRCTLPGQLLLPARVQTPGYGGTLEPRRRRRQLGRGKERKQNRELSGRPCPGMKVSSFKLIFYPTGDLIRYHHCKTAELLRLKEWGGNWGAASLCCHFFLKLRWPQEGPSHLGGAGGKSLRFWNSDMQLLILNFCHVKC